MSKGNFNKNPGQWQSNVVDKAAMLAGGALAAGMAMDAMAEEDEYAPEGDNFQEDDQYDDQYDDDEGQVYDNKDDNYDDDYDDGGGEEMRIDEWSKNNLNIPPMLTDHISDSVDPLPSNEL